MTVLFVYGTLREGEKNQALLGSSKRIGVVRTAPRYTLVDLGPYPGLRDDGLFTVTGELYMVDPATLSRIDELERHPQWYRRDDITLEDGMVVQGYILPLQFCEAAPVIDSGDWKTRQRTD